ncbi:MAG: type II toxin-antitoxin system RelE/ParE family toxin [Pseudomonadota bacterium]|nr:type II toxin-antitoxin system RelE/ParE family toxin [Pseudomonadota bacterium]MDP1904610.1 type II toxin-antitoxin system RelE/ParE family toxin [Pseudomonadota bacterium]MDP2353255.1 type II toxin-antitoxin system RelE/ParE family toxin [Pseudomonadota bacterium]
MTHKVVFRRQARAEFDAAADWYEQERAGLSAEFHNAIDRVLERIASQPAQFPKIQDDIRRAVDMRFPYCVYFRVRGQVAVVLAVLHSARNPAIWRGRE